MSRSPLHHLMKILMLTTAATALRQFPAEGVLARQHLAQLQAPSLSPIHIHAYAFMQAMPSDAGLLRAPKVLGLNHKRSQKGLSCTCGPKYVLCGDLHPFASSSFTKLAQLPDRLLYTASFISMSGLCRIARTPESAQGPASAGYANVLLRHAAKELPASPAVLGQFPTCFLEHSLHQVLVF